MNNLKTKLLVPLSVISSLAVPVFAFAGEVGSSSIVSSFQSSLTAFQGDFNSMKDLAVPFVLTITAAFLGIRLAKRFFSTVAR